MENIYKNEDNTNMSMINLNRTSSFHMFMFVNVQ